MNRTLALVPIAFLSVLSFAFAAAEPSAHAAHRARTVACSSNADCGALELCLTEGDGATCGGYGVCTPRGVNLFCSHLDVQACGCDGKPYPNACIAHKAGVSIDSAPFKEANIDGDTLAEQPWMEQGADALLPLHGQRHRDQRQRYVRGAHGAAVHARDPHLQDRRGVQGRHLLDVRLLPRARLRRRRGRVLRRAARLPQYVAARGRRLRRRQQPHAERLDLPSLILPKRKGPLLPRFHPGSKRAFASRRVAPRPRGRGGERRAGYASSVMVPRSAKPRRLGTA